MKFNEKFEIINEKFNKEKEDNLKPFVILHHTNWIRIGSVFQTLSR